MIVSELPRHPTDLVGLFALGTMGAAVTERRSAAEPTRRP